MQSQVIFQPKELELIENMQKTERWLEWSIVPWDPLYLDIELFSQASCEILYTSSHWSGSKDLSLCSETELSFQGWVAGGKGQGSPVSSHLPLMCALPNIPKSQEIPSLLMS